MEKKRKKKGQVAFEFLMVYIILLFFFLAALYIITKEATYSQIYAENIFAREVASRIATEINIASRYIGYEKVLQIPTTISGGPYSLQIVAGSVLVSYTSIAPVNYYYPLETKNVTNPKGHSVFEINTSRGYINIKNVGGKVIIE